MRNVGVCNVACQCDPQGAMYNRCEDETGQCYCKIGFSGLKCDVCRSPTAVFNGSHCIELRVTPTTSPAVAIDDSQWRPSATRRVTFGKKVGSMCWSDFDCTESVRHSHCLDGYCSCLSGRLPTDSGRRCMAALRSAARHNTRDDEQWCSVARCFSSEHLKLLESQLQCNGLQSNGFLESKTTQYQMLEGMIIWQHCCIEQCLLLLVRVAKWKFCCPFARCCIFTRALVFIHGLSVERLKKLHPFVWNALWSLNQVHSLAPCFSRLCSAWLSSTQNCNNCYQSVQKYSHFYTAIGSLLRTPKIQSSLKNVTKSNDFCPCHVQCTRNAQKFQGFHLMNVLLDKWV